MRLDTVALVFLMVAAAGWGFLLALTLVQAGVLW